VSGPPLAAQDFQEKGAPWRGAEFARKQRKSKRQSQIYASFSVGGERGQQVRLANVILCGHRDMDRTSEAEQILTAFLFFFSFSFPFWQ